VPTLTQNMVAESAALLPEYTAGFLAAEDGEGTDPFVAKFPLADRDVWKVTWDQRESAYGLMPQSALDAPPELMVMPGVRVTEVEPGVYRGYTKLLESELTKSRQPGTLADPLDVGDRLAAVMNYFGEMLASRIFKIYADLGLNGYFVNQSATTGAQHTYQIRRYSRISMSAWAGSPTTATPIDDLRAAASTLGRGTSSRFGAKSQLLMTDEAVTTLLATTQIRSTFKSPYGATVLAPFDIANATGKQPDVAAGAQSLNKLFMGMGLPEIVPWNRGYYPLLSDVQNQTKANFVKFLGSTSAVWLGYRPNGQQSGQFTFAKHIGNAMGPKADYDVASVKAPGSVTQFGKNIYVAAHVLNEQPHGYKFEMGANCTPEVWYEDAMAAVYWA
jgi:hypothetical protein